MKGPKGSPRAAAVAASPRGEPRPLGKVVFVFSGQGGAWPGMGLGLAGEEPVFRRWLERCGEAVQQEGGFSPLAELAAGEGAAPATVERVQPTLFSLQVALAALWRSWGVEPEAVLGHSMGEAAAACVCGALSLEEAARLICHRSRLLHRLHGQGALALVALGEREVRARLAARGDERVWVAASNSPTTTLLSGEAPALESLLSELAAEEIFCRRAPAEVPFHSPLVDPLEEELRAGLGTLSPRCGEIPFFSSLGLAWSDGSTLDADYWWGNLRQPVRFAAAVERLAVEGYRFFVELSPHPVLTLAVEQCLEHAGLVGRAVPSLRRGDEGVVGLLSSLGELYTAGHPVDWRSLFPAGPPPHLPSRWWWGDGPGHGDESPPPGSAAASAEPLRRRLLAAGPEQRRRELARWLRRWLAAGLGRDAADLDLDQPLVGLGLDSLMALELRNRLQADLAVRLPVGRLLGRKRLAADLAEEVLAELVATGGAEPPVTPVTGPRGTEPGLAEDELPCSYGQRALWLLHRRAPESDAYNLAYALRLHGEVQVAALARALATSIDRHPALRTTFVERGGQPVARIHPRPLAPLVVVDAGGWDEETLRREMARIYRRPFDLEAGPLFRSCLFRRPDRAPVLLLSVHHIVFDLSSYGLLLDELGRLYAAELQGPGAARSVLTAEPAATYGDFVAAQGELLASPRGEALAAWWDRHLNGAPTLLELPTDLPRPKVESFRGDAYPFHLGPELAARLRGFAAERGVTIYSVLLAVFQLLLHRYTGADDLLVGSPTSGRAEARFEEVVGYFVNLVVLRARLADDPPFAELLDHTAETALEAIEHQEYPFSSLVERLAPDRDPGRQPLIQALFVLQAPQRIKELSFLGETGRHVHLGGEGGLEVEFLDTSRRTEGQFDLTLMVFQHPEALAPVLFYRTDLFHPTTIARLAGHFVRLLTAAVAQPGERLSRLPLLSPAERAQLRVEWSDTQVPRSELPLHRLFTARAVARPEAVALAMEEAELTYGELARRVGALARRLRDHGVGPDTRVALLLERGLELPVAILGILAAGGAYVPLDPSHPRDRLTSLLADCGASRVLTEEHSGGWIGSGMASVLHLDGAEVSPSQGPAAPLEVSVLPESLAYLIYTSGSTGQPKGVMVSHGALQNQLRWMLRAYPQEPGDAVLGKTPTHFDASVWELLTPLLAGARLVLARPGGDRESDYLARVVVEQGITLFQGVPSLLALLLAEPGLALGHRLRRLYVGGEALTAALVRQATERLGVEIVNLYGPTETTVQVLSWRARPGSGRLAVSLGRPVDGARMVVAGLDLVPVPLGVPGELLIGGTVLARGYLARPALTAERFVPDPFSGPSPGTPGATPGARLYRSGDRVRWRPDGQLDFLGRLDHQVKLRGLRIEPGEIAAVLADHPGVGRAVVVLWPPAPEAEGRLVAYVVPAGSEPPRSGELREFLLARLPAYMVPAAFLILDELPLTTTGKLDRRTLPAPGRPAQDPSGDPRTPVEEMLAGIWAEVLSLPRVGVDDELISLGAYSLLAARVASRIRLHLGVDLPLATLFEASTVAAQARRVESSLGGGREAPPPIEPVPRDAAPPLSFAQQRLWLIDRLQPGLALYNVAHQLDFGAELRPGPLARALTEVVRRHEVLRTGYRVAGDLSAGDGLGGDGPVQEVAPAEPLPLPVVDLSALPPARVEAVSDLLARREARRPFDLGRPPLLRAVSFRLGAAWRLALTVHHIAFDLSSREILLRELALLYRAFIAGEPSPLPPLRVQYADYAVWQRRLLAGELLAAELAHWRERLAGAPHHLELPTDRPRTRTGYAGGLLPLRLEAERCEPLLALGRRRGATPFMTLLAVFQSLLVRLTGQTTPVVGAPVLNRGQAELEGLIGFFTNMLVLAPDLSGDPGVGEVIDRVRRITLAAYTHQEVPFDKLVELLQPERDLDRHPLFQVSFTVTAAGGDLASSATGGWTRVSEVETGLSKFDLSLLLTSDGDGFSGLVTFRRELFDLTTVDRWSRAFARLVDAFGETPERSLSSLPLLSPAEQAQLLAEWNDTARCQPDPAVVHELFAAVAAARPERVAVVSGPSALSYAGLARRAGRLGERLQRMGVGPEVPVGVLLERSPELVEAILGVLMAGGAYVPLDPGHPEERLRFVTEDSGAALVLSAFPLAACGAGLGSELILLHELGEAPPAANAGPVRFPPMTGENRVYVMYTSGSTGRPKGVEAVHRGVVRLVREGGFAEFGPDEVLLGYAPVSFDASTLEIWAPLLNGGRLALAPPGLLSLGELTQVVAREAITSLWLTAPLFHQMVEGPVARLSGLRRLMAGGDALAPDRVEQAAAALPGCALINGYGPTENTTFTSCHLLGAEEGIVPIGRPIGNTRVRVLDRRLQPAPAGVYGELCAGGLGLARGYLRRPGLTAERFVPDPFSPRPGERLYRTGDRVRWRADGALEFLGREDHQVKVRGYRIELGEIEAELTRHPGVREGVVVARGEEGGDKRLVAYVVPEPEVRLETGEMAAALRRHLPEHMVPSLWVELDELPLTPSGKLDRRALPAPEVGGPAREPAAPRNELEQVLATVWEEVLELRPIGMEDHFFDLGGHSLHATRVIARVRRICGVEVPLRAIFDAPRLRDFARRVEEALRRGQGPEAPALRPRSRDRPLPLSFAQERLWLYDRLQPGSAGYNMSWAAVLLGALEVRALERTLRAIVDRHESLRTIFQVVGDEPRQVILPPGRFRLPEVDLGALPDATATALAHRLAAHEGGRPFDLARGPLFRAALLRRTRGEHVLLATMHHIVSDGWSTGILTREMEALYRGFTAGEPVSLPPLPIGYPDFAAWQREVLSGPVLAAHLEFWRRQVGDDPPILELPTDRPRSVHRSARGSSRTLRLAPSLAGDLQTLVRERGGTLFMALLAAFSTLLHRHGGGRRVHVGTPVAGRDQEEVEGLIGFFVNTLTLCVDLGGGPPFLELLARVREVVLGAFLHRELPFEKLVADLRLARDPSRHPLFQAMLVLQNAPQGVVRLPGVDVRPLGRGPEHTAKFDLTLSAAEEGEALRLTLSYDAELFDPTTAARLVRHLRNLLAAAVAAPETRLPELPLLSAAEVHQLCREWPAAAGRRPGTREQKVVELIGDRGHEGELRVCIAGPGLRARPAGVWGRLCLGWEGGHGSPGPGPAQTAATHVPDPFSGRGGARLLLADREARYRPDGRLELRRPPGAEAPVPETTAPAAGQRDRLARRREGLSDKKRALLARLARGKGSGAGPVASRRSPSPASPAPTARPGTIPRRSEGGPLPLSYPQEHLWLVEQLRPGRPTYNVPLLLELDAGWDGAVVARALAEIVRRHEILRTRYEARKGEPVQVVEAPQAPALPRVDLAALGSPDALPVAQSLFSRLARLAFQLDSPPCLRALLLCPPDAPRRLAVAVHHIAFDAWSGDLFDRELRELCAAFAAGRSSPLAELPVQYGDFALWQRARLTPERLEPLLTFWRRELAGIPGELPLPRDRPRPPVRSGRGKTLRFHLSTSLSEGLRSFSRQRGLTLFITLLTAFKVLLRSLSGQATIVVGSAVASRELIELEALIGFFLNTLVLATDLSGDPPYEEAVRQVQRTTSTAFKHQDLPFGHLVRELNPDRSASRQALFQVMFSLDAGPAGSELFPPDPRPGAAAAPRRRGLSVDSSGRDAGASKFDLSLGIRDRPGEIDVAINFDLDLFDDTTIFRWVGSYQRLLAALVEDPGRPLSALPLLSSGERAQVVREWPDIRFGHGLDSRLEELFSQMPSQLCRPADVGGLEELDTDLRDAHRRGPVSIGRPLDRYTLQVADGALFPVPVGVEGELLVGGVGLPPGYLGRPGLTAERFLPDPFAGERDGVPGGRLHRTGNRARWRADGQIDLLGHRLPVRPIGELHPAAPPAPDRSAEPTGQAVADGELQQALVEIWREVLAVPELGVTDDFFSLGGHSLLAMRLMARIEERLGINLPLTSLFAAPTVEGLAAELHRGEAQRSAKALVAIQPEGSRPPLFCVHPVSGEVLAYLPLARSLGTEQPFYALQCRPHELYGKAVAVSIEAMAARYLHEVREAQPRGPYRLGGWSFGGVVAYEMARQLVHVGEEVAALALIDSFAPQRWREEPGEEVMLGRFLRDLAGITGVGPERIPELPASRSEILAVAAELLGLTGDSAGRRVESLYATFAAHQGALVRYHPGDYPGTATLFAATEGRRRDPSGGWSRWVGGGVEVVEIRGDHYSLLRDPDVGRLGEALCNVLTAGRDD